MAVRSFNTMRLRGIKMKSNKWLLVSSLTLFYLLQNSVLAGAGYMMRIHNFTYNSIVLTDISIADCISPDDFSLQKNWKGKTLASFQSTGWNYVETKKSGGCFFNKLSSFDLTVGTRGSANWANTRIFLSNRYVGSMCAPGTRLDDVGDNDYMLLACQCGKKQFGSDNWHHAAMGIMTRATSLAAKRNYKQILCDGKAPVHCQYLRNKKDEIHRRPDPADGNLNCS